MLLKRLELIGFKSFAQKTTLEFPAGVTGVVGPNGSGKSNVIDALRWILGERDAKKIRAGKSENLIFNGGAGKTPAGFAEVTIVFDNSSGFFDLDFSEISVRRRVSRSGVSQYFLNDSEVRLKDIIDFFSKARLGTKGFSIINQGNSDMFIRATPVERRVMLEEVLGLRQYQIKRHEAERKLNTTKENLAKVQALTEELLPHLRMLRRQSKKWERHDELQLELVTLEKQYFGYKLYDLAIQEQGLAPKLKTFEEQIRKEQQELELRQKALQEIENNQPKSDTGFDDFKKKQNDILGKRSQIQKELGRLEAELEFLLHRPKVTAKEADLLSLVGDTKKIITSVLTLESIAEIKSRLKELDQKIKLVLEGEKADTSSKQAELESTKAKLMTELASIEKDLTDLGSMEDKLAQGLRDFNASFKAAFTKVEEKKEDINKLEGEKRKLIFESERIGLRREDLARQARQLDRDLNTYRATASPVDTNLDTLERSLLKVRGDLASIGDIDPQVIKEAQDMEKRYEFLSNQGEDLDQAIKDLKDLILELKSKLHDEFKEALTSVNKHFNDYVHIMFSGGKAKLNLIKNKPVKEKIVGEEISEEEIPMEESQEVDEGGLEIDIMIPRKNIRSLDMLSGGERSLVSIAVLFALISVSPPPFLVLDEVDAALDESNTRRFADLIKDFAKESQFIVVTHNRATVSAANILYGVTMGSDGTSKLLSINLDEIEAQGKPPH